MVETVPAGGGSICAAARVRTQSGRRLFVKHLEAAPPGLFEAEARGLEALRVEGGPRIPRVVHVGPDHLILEDLGTGHAGTAAWERLGEALATLHRKSAPAFGFETDNFIGRTPQRNPWTEDGPTFFAEHRLLALARACHERRGLPSETLRAIERLAGRLRDLLPDEAPALIHGDLWTGNVHPCADGTIALIDPAAHFGYREADLAMTRLFAPLPPRFYAAYEAVWPLAPGAEERIPLFNLYHLLNHLLLFGGAYEASVTMSVQRLT